MADLVEYLYGGADTTWGKLRIQDGRTKPYETKFFELGNEQNTNYSPTLMAANFKVLSDLLVKLYPAAASRPKIIGPDVHG